MSSEPTAPRSMVQSIVMPDYKHYLPYQARHLWRVGYGMRDRNGVLDVDPVHLIQCPDGDGELSVVFGAPCLTIGECLRSMGIDFRCWVSAASMIVMFDSSVIPRLKESLDNLFGERQQMYAIKCDRENVATAIRDYRVRRDEFLKA